MDWWRSRATSENHKRIQSVEKHRERSLGVSPVEVWLARASKDWKSFRSRKKPHGSFCPPFWILTVEWSGARSCLFWWRRRFQIASFSPSTQENSVFEKHRFQIASLCRAFTNGSVFGDRFRRCSVDDSRIRSKTAPFSFESLYSPSSVTFDRSSTKD